MALSTRVSNYYKLLQKYWRLRSYVMSPYFNATKEQRVYSAFNSMNSQLKEEAESLWGLGINVYH